MSLGRRASQVTFAEPAALAIERGSTAPMTAMATAPIAGTTHLILIVDTTARMATGPSTATAVTTAIGSFGYGFRSNHSESRLSGNESGAPSRSHLSIWQVSLRNSVRSAAHAALDGAAAGVLVVAICLWAVWLLLPI